MFDFLKLDYKINIILIFSIRNKLLEKMLMIKRNIIHTNKQAVLAQQLIRHFASSDPQGKPKGSYIPPKPPSMRKVVRDKDKYQRGVYTISQFGLKALQKNKSVSVVEDTEKDGDEKAAAVKAIQDWYTVYSLPTEHVQSFKSRKSI